MKWILLLLMSAVVCGCPLPSDSATSKTTRYEDGIYITTVEHEGWRYVIATSNSSGAVCLLRSEKIEGGE